MIKPTKWVCAQRRLRSAWASAQSDQSLRCAHEESLGPYLSIGRTAKTLIKLGGHPDLSLRWAHTHSVGFVMSRLKLKYHPEVSATRKLAPVGIERGRPKQQSNLLTTGCILLTWLDFITWLWLEKTLRIIINGPDGVKCDVRSIPSHITWWS